MHHTHTHPQTKDTTVRVGKASASRTGAITSFLQPRPAYADEPLCAATLGAAIITAVGAVVAAGLIGTATIIAAGISKDGKGGDSKGGDSKSSDSKSSDGESHLAAVGTPPTDQRVGDESLPVAVRGFLHRDIHASASQTGSSTGSRGDREATATATYRFDGDIKSAPAEHKQFGFQDKVILRFDISNIENSHDAPLIVTVDDLTLSTVDVANTDGHAAIEFSAVQGADVLWRWAARVNQAKIPQITDPASSVHRIVRQEKNLLIVRKLQVPVAYKAPGANGTTSVEIIMTVDAAGART